MKKIITILLAAFLLLSLAACGNETTPDDKENAAMNNGERVEASDTKSTEDSTKSETNAPKKEITFNEIVAIDDENCSIKVTGIDDKNYTLNVMLENKSAEKNYMFGIKNASINGVQCDPLFAKEVVAGKKANTKMDFPVQDLQSNGIDEYTDIEITFHVYDNDNWIDGAIVEKTIHIYPYGEDKAVKFVREVQASDNVIVDNEFVTAIVTGYDEDGIFGYTANLFLLNKTDKNILFSVDGASVNGFMADPFYATSVGTGKCAFSSISWSDTVLEENKIEKIETIEFTFRAHDEDDWNSDDFVNEIITLNP